ncbi:hypothetical protein HZS_299 [Henneguya salminicola]|nr:hypothetical protein HZS_299 [Henneguya salminicola]
MKTLSSQGIILPVPLSDYLLFDYGINQKELKINGWLNAFARLDRKKSSEYSQICSLFREN